MNVLCVQYDIAWEDKAANFDKVGRLLEQAGVAAGSLVVLPEMFSTGFSMDVAAVHEGHDHPAEAFLADTARRLGAAVLGGVVIRGSDGRGRNQALLIGPGGQELARYTKMHPFSYAGETGRYVPGERPVVAGLLGMKLAPFICYDLRFPEVFRSAAAGGAEVLAVIANWPAARQEHWLTLLRARAIENQAFVIGVNRVGSDPNCSYAGGSMIVGPRGEVITDAGGVERILPAELDLEALRAYREDFPALADMKADWVRR